MDNKKREQLFAIINNNNINKQNKDKKMTIKQITKVEKNLKVHNKPDKKLDNKNINEKIESITLENAELLVEELFKEITL
jgi:hypothetical protein